jgi:hypothetical protein
LKLSNICFQFSKSIYVIPFLISQVVHSKNTTKYTLQKEDTPPKKDKNDIGIYIFVAFGAIALISATFFICYHSCKTIKRRIRAKVFPSDIDASSSKNSSTKDTNSDSVVDKKAAKPKEDAFTRDIKVGVSQSWPQIRQKVSIEQDSGDEDISVPEGFLGHKKSFMNLKQAFGVDGAAAVMSAETKAHASAPAMLEYNKEGEEMKDFQSFLD